MYDPDTTSLIKQAPQLSGLDNSDLPRMLTSAYAEIVAGRIRARGINQAEDNGELKALITRMRKLAFTNEAMVSARVGRENRKSAAFVAGSAHHVVLMAQRPATAVESFLRADSISSEVAGALLFLIAEASADASEMAKQITLTQERSVEATLLRGIKHLAEGRLPAIVDTNFSRELIIGSSPQETAVNILYAHVFNGLVVLAKRILGIETEGDPEAHFNEVKQASKDDMSTMFHVPLGRIVSVFPGPLHLASLLSAVGQNLLGSALTQVQSPPSASPAIWKRNLEHIAKSRPFLWSNHRSAVDSGYLEPGVSAAVSFPTGAGKSTLSELKIAAAIARGVKTVFLVPTLALVDQTVRSLGNSFPEEQIESERAEGQSIDIDLDDLPQISVMTPERCLAMMSFEPGVFSTIGLIVFDECHLLHPRDMDNSRRAIDAMLCLLNLTISAPNTDILLLSAMMKNAEQLAAWIQELTARTCLPLTLNWKPTRQVRGCVVYEADALNAIRHRVRTIKAEGQTKGPSTVLRRSLTIAPQGLFSLSQTWVSIERSNYSLLRLLEQDVLLSINPTDWYLTANSNQVSAAIASASACRGIKTLIFVQTIPFADSTVNATTGDAERHVSLNQQEAVLYEAALDELGDRSALYLELDAAGNLARYAVCHHGDLLPAERILHESIFRRSDGTNIMVATSTLAQGMNLPSELVIISGDSRFDQAAGQMERLGAHELLNAAGRAGRAGINSYGMVLVVPSKVIDFNDSTNNIHSTWMELQAIFSQSDQCLDIADPFEALLDQIASTPDEVSKNAKYFVSRLPIGSFTEDGGADERCKTLLSKSFSAFKARQANQNALNDTRINAVLAFRSRSGIDSSNLTWRHRLAATMAVPIEMVDYWGRVFNDEVPRRTSVADWLVQVYAWLSELAHLLPEVLRLSNLESLLGAEYKALTADRERGEFALRALFPVLRLWMQGEPLTVIQQTLKPNDPIKKCNKAREFALKVVPELTYLLSLPAATFKAFAKENGRIESVPLGLDCLAPCAREGFSSVEMLAYSYFRKAGRLNRRSVHREFVEWKNRLLPFEADDVLIDIVRRIEDLSLFTNLDET